MKKRNFFILMLSLLMLFSCDKTDEITAILNESGSLEVRIVDKDNKPMENVDVSISISNGGALYSGKTNSSGICEIDKILQGTYYCKASFTVGKIAYSVEQYFQLFTNEKKVLDMNAFADTYDMNVSIKPIAPVTDITKYSVALFSYGQSIPSTGDIGQAALVSQKIATDNKVKFTDIPGKGRTYQLVIYKDNVAYDRTNTLSVFREDVDTEMFLSFGEIEVNIIGVITTPSDYEVMIVDMNNIRDLSNIETVRGNALFSGSVNNEGNVKFPEVPFPYNSFKLLIYQKNSLLRSDYIYFNQSSIPPHMSITLDLGVLKVNTYGQMTNITDYSVAIVAGDYSTNNVNELEKRALYIKKLDSNKEAIFNELVVGISYRIYIYKDNKIYDSRSVYMNNKDRTEPLYIYE